MRRRGGLFLGGAGRSGPKGRPFCGPLRHAALGIAADEPHTAPFEVRVDVSSFVLYNYDTFNTNLFGSEHYARDDEGL
jgi:hypothetical protein